MTRFRYPLQAALDDVRARERASLAVLARARAFARDEATALVVALDQARAVRANLARDGACRGSAYVEAGVRLVALAAAARERRDRLARADEIAAGAGAESAHLTARRRAVERDRDRRYGRWLAARALQDARDLDEANAARRGAVHTPVASSS